MSRGSQACGEPPPIYFLVAGNDVYLKETVNNFLMLLAGKGLGLQSEPKVDELMEEGIVQAVVSGSQQHLDCIRVKLKEGLYNDFNKGQGVFSKKVPGFVKGKNYKEVKL